jgi:hypothetical protein
MRRPCVCLIWVTPISASETNRAEMIEVDIL